MKIKQYLFLPFLFLPLVLFPLKDVFANEITSCGDDFSNAVPLQEGENTGGVINKGDSCYYYINSKAGYELDVRYKITGDNFSGSVSLYNSEKSEIAGSIESEDTIKWLGADSEPTKYYLVVENSYKADTQLYDVTLVDKTDANSGTDAGGDFDGSLDIEYGEYTGYLSTFTHGSMGGDDESDYYKLAVNRGDTVEIKVTPSGDFEAGCAVYDSNRAELFNEEGLDLQAGQIIQETFDIQSDGYIYIVVKQAYFGEKWNSIDQYTLLVTNQDIEEMGGEITVKDDTKESDKIDAKDSNKVDVKDTNTKDIIIKLSLIALGVLIVVLIVLLVIRSSKKNKKETKKGTPSEDSKSVPPKNSKVETKETKDEGMNKVKVTVEEGTDVEISTIETEKQKDDKSAP